MGALRSLLPRKMPQDSPKPPVEAALFHVRSLGFWMVGWDKPGTWLGSAPPPSIILFGTLRDALFLQTLSSFYDLELEAAPRSPDPRVAFQQHQIFRHAKKMRGLLWPEERLDLDRRVVTFCSRISYLGVLRSSLPGFTDSPEAACSSVSSLSPHSGWHCEK